MVSISFRIIRPALLTLLILVSITLLSYASHISTVQANVTVGCPFAVTENVLSAYPIYGNASLNYSIITTYSCSISSMVGNFYIIDPSNGSILYNRQLIANDITKSPIVNYISFNTLNLENKTYYAKINYSKMGMYNFSEKQFSMLYPANIVINSVSYESSILQNSQVPFTIFLQNKGQYASGKIDVNISISGPTHTTYNYSIVGLSPRQYENLSISTNASSIPGIYSVNVTVSYKPENTAANILKSDHFSYSVTALQSSGNSPSGPVASSPPPAYPQITPIPSLDVSSVPLYVSLLTGSSTVSSITIKNTANATESISISVPEQFSNIFSLSATNLTLQSMQSISVEIFENASSNLQNGQRVIPIQIEASTDGITTKQMEYVGFSTYSNYTVNPLEMNQMNMVNNTNIASDILGIRYPQNQNLSNITIQTIIPEALIDNISQIQSYGIASSMHVVKNAYVINWYPSKLSVGAETYGYYVINKPKNQELLSQIQNVVISTSQASTEGTFRLINQKVPIFYTNTPNTVQIDLLYTGSVPKSLSIVLSGQASLKIMNSTQYVNATPNELIIKNFNILPGSESGTSMLNLYVFAQDANLTTSFPILVLSNVTSTNNTVQESQLDQIPKSIGGYPFEVMLIIIMIAVIIFILVLKISHKFSMSYYDNQRAYKLKNIKININRKTESE